MWCEQQGLKPVSQKKLKPSLKLAFPNVTESRDGALGPRGWVGIRLTTDAPARADFDYF